MMMEYYMITLQKKLFYFYYDENRFEQFKISEDNSMKM